jgi:hypothetical protein
MVPFALRSEPKSTSMRVRFTGIPEIFDVLQEHPAALKGAYWTPQVVGGTGFIISSCVSTVTRPTNASEKKLNRLLRTFRTLYMLETQKKWYIPAPTSLGWHIGCKYPTSNTSISTPPSLPPALSKTSSSHFCYSLELHRRYRFHALRRFWILHQKWADVPKLFVNILGRCVSGFFLLQYAHIHYYDMPVPVSVAAMLLSLSLIQPRRAKPLTCL